MHAQKMQALYLVQMLNFFKIVNFLHIVFTNSNNDIQLLTQKENA